MFVVFLLWLGNAPSEGKSICVGVTATNFWLNFLRANDYFFQAKQGLYDIFPETAGWCCQHFLWTMEQCREHLIFPVISSFVDQIQSLSLLNAIFYKHIANKSPCSNIVTTLENHERQNKKLRYLRCPEMGSYIQKERNVTFLYHLCVFVELK